MTDVAAQPSVARVAGESVLVLLVVLAYLWLFRAYGFDIVDEGTQLAQIDRVAHGARPYIDFETGYTPWYYALEVALWRLGGAEILATRTFGVLLQATTLALLFAFARAWFGSLLALGLVAFDLAFLLPISPRGGAPFNTPYPGWITAPLALLVQVLAARVVQARLGEGRRASGSGAWPLLMGGVLAGVAFSVKPNTGLLALAGAGLAVAASWPADDRLARVLAWLVRGAAILVGVVLLGHATLAPTYAVALLLPVLVAALRSAPMATRPHVVVRPLADAALLALGFTAPVALWVVPLLRELGAARFAREVLLLDGGGVIDAYLLPLVMPGGAALAVCAGFVAAALLAARARTPDHATAVVSRGQWLVPAALALGVAVTVTMDRGTPVLRIAEEVCLWLGPAGLVTGLVLLPRAPATAHLHALLAFAALFSLQLFPRPDLIHVAMGAPPVLLALGAAWWWLGLPLARRRTRGMRGSLAQDAAGLLLMLCLYRMFPALEVRLNQPLAPMDLGPRAPLWIAATSWLEHRWIGEAVRDITNLSSPGDAVFYFPDLAGLGFLSARPSPFFYLYFVPGRPDRAGEQRTLAELERHAPRLAVWGTPRVPAFAGAGEYFAGIVGYLDEHYRPVATLPECTVAERVPGS